MGSQSSNAARSITYFRPGTYALVPNKHLLPQMKGAPLSVYVTLCAHADAEGVCFPGVKRLVDTTGYDRASIFRALTKLIELGVIERHRRLTDQGDADSNLYRILLSDVQVGSSENATTQSHQRDGGSRMDATTGSRTDATLTNPVELNHLTKGKNVKSYKQQNTPEQRRTNDVDNLPNNGDNSTDNQDRLRELIRQYGVSEGSKRFRDEKATHVGALESPLSSNTAHDAPLPEKQALALDSAASSANSRTRLPYTKSRRPAVVDLAAVATAH